MPGFDRTGPWGEGPRTGWGMGRCAPSPAEADPRAIRRGLQRGFRRGFSFFGRGRGGAGFGGGSRWVRPGREIDPPEGDVRSLLVALSERLERIEARLSAAAGEPSAARGEDQDVSK